MGTVVKKILDKNKSRKVANAIKDSISKIDNELDILEFSYAVADVVLEDYGDHLTRPFMDILKLRFKRGR